MAIIMTPSAPSISRMSGYALIAEIRAGGDGDPNGVPEYDLGNGSDFATGHTTWTRDISNGFETATDAFHLDTGTPAAGSNATLNVQDSMDGQLSYPGLGGAPVLSVQFRVAIQADQSEVDWSWLSVNFYKNGVLTETVPVTSRMQVDSFGRSSSQVQEEVCTVLPTRNDNDEAIVTGSVHMQSKQIDTLPDPNGIFGQVLVYTVGGVTSTGAANQNYYVARDADGVHTDVWVNSATPGIGAADLTFLSDGPGVLSFVGSPGDDVLTLDFSNGNPLPAGGVSFDGGTGTNKVGLVGTAGSDTLTATSSGGTFTSTFGAAPITFANVQGLQFPGGSGGSDAIDVTSGSYTVDANAPSGLPAIALSVEAGANATFTGSQRLASLNVNGGSVHVQTSSTRRTMNIGALSISSGGQFDIGRSDLLTYTPEATLLGYIITGRHGGVTTAGDWRGPGLTSNLAQINRTLYSLGIATYGDPVAIPLATGQSVVSFTTLGDANLDHRTDNTDFVIWQTYQGTGNCWAEADFNYDGLVNSADYTWWRTNLGHTTA